MKTVAEAINKYNQSKGKTLKIKAVLFDMDGVLFDSMKNHTEAWFEAISEVGIPCTREEFYLFEGATGNYTINRKFKMHFDREATEKEIKEIYQRKSVIFNQLPQAQPMPYAYEMLMTVKKAGLIPVLVTGSGQHSLLERLNKHFPDVFLKDKMVTAYDVLQGKPHPEPYLKGLKKAGIEAHEAIVVENAPLGVKSASTAGVFTVAVNTGPIDDEILWEEGANLLYPSVKDFQSILGDLCIQYSEIRQ